APISQWGNLDGWHQAMWMVHVLTFFVFVAILPITMLRHMFTSPLNMYLKDRERPKGAMKPMPNLMETELESFGASVIEEFTWKQLLDTDACTMCGRCTARCPAHATGKPLDPREIVLKTGEVMAASGSPVVSPPLRTVPEHNISSSSLFERITPAEIWGCAGSLDDKKQKVDQARARLMQRAGLDFAIHGPSEMWTGGPARRSGNEYVFQMLAMQNVEMLNGMGVKKIVTQCPHCLNTLLN